MKKLNASLETSKFQKGYNAHITEDQIRLKDLKYTRKRLETKLKNINLEIESIKTKTKSMKQ